MTQLPVIMCTWKRLHLLPRTLGSLRRQTSSDFHLYLWNNNHRQRVVLNQIVARYGKHINISVYHHPTNIGGFGRFRLAKRLSRQYRYCAFIDDDQTFDTHLIQTFAANTTLYTIQSWYSFVFPPDVDYWGKSHTTQSPIHYCGTGGMLCDTKIFEDSRLYNTIPPKFRFVEDLWLSFFASHIRGWKLKHIDLPIETVDSVNDQCHGLRGVKTACLYYLSNTYGWPKYD